MPSLTEAINLDRGAGLWWVHLLGLVAVAVVFCILMVAFNTDIMVLEEKMK